MNLKFWEWGKPKPQEKKEPDATPKAEPSAYYGAYAPNYGMGQVYDGEKSMGGIGPVERIYVDHYALSTRSWDLYLKSEVIQMIFKRVCVWVIGEGLELQSNPQVSILKSAGIDIDSEEFNESVESQFINYSNSTSASYSNMVDLCKLQSTAFINSIVGGHVLVIVRVKKGIPNIQLIDGINIGTPPTAISNGYNSINPDNGNVINMGIEKDQTGQHVAYWVRNQNFGIDYTRISVYHKNGYTKMAFLVYGLEYRLDNDLGLPLVSAIMETSKKLERYKEAQLGKAEENANIVYSLERGIGTDNATPFQNRLATSLNVPNPADPMQPRDIYGNNLANQIQITTGKTVVDTGRDNKLVAHQGAGESEFGDFYTINVEVICATVGIPPNVALQKYNDSFSASRAALKDWEHSLRVMRRQFYTQFMQPIYNVWLDLEVLQNFIKAPGYLQALMSANTRILDAYRFATFTGPNVPHIDPMKEVMAERAKLGPKFANVNLTTMESATRALNGGNSTANMKQAQRELDEAVELGLGPDEETPPMDGEDTGGSGGGVYVKGYYKKKAN